MMGETSQHEVMTHHALDTLLTWLVEARNRATTTKQEPSLSHLAPASDKKSRGANFLSKKLKHVGSGASLGRLGAPLLKWPAESREEAHFAVQEEEAQQQLSSLLLVSHCSIISGCLPLLFFLPKTRQAVMGQACSQQVSREQQRRGGHPHHDQ